MLAAPKSPRKFDSMRAAAGIQEPVFLASGSIRTKHVKDLRKISRAALANDALDGLSSRTLRLALRVDSVRDLDASLE